MAIRNPTLALALLLSACTPSGDTINGAALDAAFANAMAADNDYDSAIAKLEAQSAAALDKALREEGLMLVNGGGDVWNVVKIKDKKPLMAITEGGWRAPVLVCKVMCVVDTIFFSTDDDESEGVVYVKIDPDTLPRRLRNVIPVMKGLAEQIDTLNEKRADDPVFDEVSQRRPRFSAV